MGKETLIIANISGFYGDRLDAAREMVEGGPVDFLTGDYLAELTMAILMKNQMKNPELGYARTFPKQIKEVLKSCLDKGIKIVVNAGGLNPKGLTKAIKELATSMQLYPKVAYIEGDNLMPRISSLSKELKHLKKGRSLAQSEMMLLSANAYLGCWGIVEALKQGADIVITGRVADTSVVMGPAAYHFQWKKDDWDALAGAATAGHIIECSGQATGGNYSFFEEIPSFHKLAFPIAEIYSDGSSVICKHPNTGGLVSVGTVTAQLMYEIGPPAYITPDVVAHFDTIQIKQEARDRVRISGTKGRPATQYAKVTVNATDGFQNEMTFHIAGLDIEKKVAILEDQFLQHIGGREQFDQLKFQFFPTHKENPQSNEEALARWQVSVKDKDPRKAGKFFTSKLVELALCTVPGWCISEAPGPAKPRIVHFPALIDKKYLRQQIHLDDQMIEITEYEDPPEIPAIEKPISETGTDFTDETTQSIYLGQLYAARSGDKGGDANLGVWAKTALSYHFLKAYLTVDKLKALLPDTAPYDIQRYEFPNLFGLNFYLNDFLGEGVAANHKLDKQAKTLGEYLRAKRIEVPISLISESKNTQH